MTWAAVNGFGRFGRDYLRSVLEALDLSIVAINDTTDAATRGGTPWKQNRLTSNGP
jgi:glyceraldehyde-3-phosphate dehydrogenase/erythrose-4-phosphate dehydrogenase